MEAQPRPPRHSRGSCRAGPRRGGFMVQALTRPEHVDVLIVGAGLSGIGAAYHLQERCPAKTYAILEGRDAIGGTWDLFRYPGIRSDSDLYTFGFEFKPWTSVNMIAGADE